MRRYSIPKAKIGVGSFCWRDSLFSPSEGRPDILIRLYAVVDWCLEHPEYTAKIKVIPKKDYPVLMPCEF